MVKKRRVPRASPDVSPAQVASNRKRLQQSLSGGTTLPLFEFGGLHILAQSKGDSLYYHVYGRDFPMDDRRIAVLEDRPGASGVGEIKRVWARGETGLREWAGSELGADERDLLVRVDDAVQNQMLEVLAYRRSLLAQSLPEERKRGRDMVRMIDRQAIATREMAGNLIDLFERLGPARDNPAVAANGPDAGAPAVPGLPIPR
jgi:hypothetical protein